MSLAWMLVSWSQWSHRSSVGLTTTCHLAFTSSFSSSFAVCVAVLLSLDAQGCCEACWQRALSACPLSWNTPATSLRVSSMRSVFARNTVGSRRFWGGEDPWGFGPAGPGWAGKGGEALSQGLSAAAWHSPSFPGAGGHRGGRKAVQESSLCRSTFNKVQENKRVVVPTDTPHNMVRSTKPTLLGCNVKEWRNRLATGVKVILCRPVL